MAGRDTRGVDSVSITGVLARSTYPQQQQIISWDDITTTTDNMPNTVDKPSNQETNDTGNSLGNKQTTVTIIQNISTLTLTLKKNMK